VSALQADGFRLRRAATEDAPWLAALAGRPEVADSLAAVSPWEEPETVAALEADPADEGRFVLEVEQNGRWLPVGGLSFSVANRRSRIAYLFGVMVDPSFRGRGLAASASRMLAVHLIRDLGYHRVQLEVYGFNEQALRVFERAGFMREGVRRKAYWRHGQWADGVHFGVVEEDLA
jgi:RimJ/RimL family protein N-acetyltransferase